MTQCVGDKEKETGIQESPQPRFLERLDVNAAFLAAVSAFASHTGRRRCDGPRKKQILQEQNITSKHVFISYALKSSRFAANICCF